MSKAENSVPGIYEIHNITNDKRYIGQTQNLYQRQCSHIGKLNRGQHPNKHLQRAWNKYSAENFEFNVLEYCDVEYLNEREVYWINFFKSDSCGYNIRLDPFSNRGLKWSDDQREKMDAVINKEGSWYKNHIVPQATLEKAWAASRNKVWTQEERDRQSKILTGTKVLDTSKMCAAQSGEKNGFAKLSEEDVKQVIYFIFMKFRVKLISQIYHVRDTTISAIKHCRSWLNINRKDVLENPKIKYKAFDRLNEFILEEM